MQLLLFKSAQQRLHGCCNLMSAQSEWPVDEASICEQLIFPFTLELGIWLNQHHLNNMEPKEKHEKIIG